MNRTYFEKSYIAFYWTLEHIFKQSQQPIAPHPFSLCDLLSNMCPFTFSNGMSADPAVYSEYKDILFRIFSEDGVEDPRHGYHAGREFIQMYMEQYDYALEDVVLLFSYEDYSAVYERICIEDAQ